MTAFKKKLLGGDDLKELYRLTNPKLNPRPKLLMVIRYAGGEWTIENSHVLRGYRGCQTNLESRVRQYESKGIWPNQCDIGIGLFEGDELVTVLQAKKLGVKPVKEPSIKRPLDILLEASGISREDLKR